MSIDLKCTWQHFYRNLLGMQKCVFFEKTYYYSALPRLYLHKNMQLYCNFVHAFFNHLILPEKSTWYCAKVQQMQCKRCFESFNQRKLWSFFKSTKHSEQNKLLSYLAGVTLTMHKMHLKFVFSHFHYSSAANLQLNWW